MNKVYSIHMQQIIRTDLKLCHLYNIGQALGFYYVYKSSPIKKAISEGLTEVFKDYIFLG